MYNRILIPTDGSDFSKEATTHGLRLAKLTGAEVTSLFVIEDTSYLNIAPVITNLSQTLEEEGNKAVAYAKSEGERMRVKVRVRIERGSAPLVIIKDSIDYDLIVMGTHGRSGISKLVMGSVTEKVVKASGCPVLVIREPAIR
jgi:nucleotide-binding universal stress UspA family protein